jgi:hypothetical protein
VILVDRKARILCDGGGNRAAHPAVRREKADPDRLFVGAHGRTDGGRPDAAQRHPGLAEPYFL